jgi:hypothetical protein
VADEHVYDDGMFEDAVKEALRARFAFVGPTGSGKTFTLLQLAHMLAPGSTPANPKIALIDTENRSASLYANRFPPFKTMKWRPPYDLDRLRDTIRYADGTGPKPGTTGQFIAQPFEVIAIDSFTHWWKGEGGALDEVDAAAKRNRSGNSYTAWEGVTPKLRAVLDAMLWSPAHIIVTMRSAMSYTLEEYTDGQGNKKTRPTKQGLAPEMRAGVEYEFTVVADMSLPDHDLAVTKSRCDVIDSLVVRKADIAEKVLRPFAEWLDDGVQLAGMAEIEALKAMFLGIDPGAPQSKDRGAVKQQFLEVFGRVDSLPADQVDAAAHWIEVKVNEWKGETPPGPAPEPPQGALTPPPEVDTSDDTPTEPTSLNPATAAALEAAVADAKARRAPAA